MLKKPHYLTISLTSWGIANAFFPAQAVAQSLSIGQVAPAFTLKSTEGKSVNLADFKGKVVVLEWVNPGCPYVRKHYDSQNMQKTQKSAKEKGVVWLAINSTEVQHQDFLKPADLQVWMQKSGAVVQSTLMDEAGQVGKSYGARTTPHMYVIDANGKLAYSGAIDSIASANKDDIPKASNYINSALNEVTKGLPVTTPQTRAYGCTVKYKAG